MKIIIVLAVLCLFTLLFRIAAGTLDIKKLNIISYAYYNILIFSFIGASLVFLGFRDHYLIADIKSEAVIHKTYLFLCYAIIVFPASVILCNFLLNGRKIRKQYEKQLQTGAAYRNGEKAVFIFSAAMAVIGISATIYMFICIGSVPILHLNQTSEELARISSQVNRNFAGNTYIKNIVVLTFVPLFSYLTYVYWRTSRKIQWGMLFFIFFITSILVKTHDLSKAPVIYYAFHFIVIEVILNNRKLFRYLFAFGALGLICIFLQYKYIMGYNTNFFTIRSGPGGRIFMTQIATLFLHIQAFPEQIPYLNGASLPTVLAKLAGIPDSWVRSGREVMKLYNPAAVSDGTAGSMNAFFIGEAYANWGTAGALAAPVIIGIHFSVAFTLLLKMKKTPLSIMLYIALFQMLTGALQGGFVDYLYNIGIILTIGLIYGISVLISRGKLGVRKPLRWKRIQ